MNLSLVSFDKNVLVSGFNDIVSIEKGRAMRGELDGS